MEMIHEKLMVYINVYIYCIKIFLSAKKEIK